MKRISPGNRFLWICRSVSAESHGGVELGFLHVHATISFRFGQRPPVLLRVKYALVQFGIFGEVGVDDALAGQVIDTIVVCTVEFVNFQIVQDGFSGRFVGVQRTGLAPNSMHMSQKRRQAISKATQQPI